MKSVNVNILLLLILGGFALYGIYSLVGDFGGGPSNMVDLTKVAAFADDVDRNLVFEDQKIVGELRVVCDPTINRCILINSPLEEVPLVETVQQ